MVNESMAKILVLGGAGYVGSATCAWLIDRQYEVWVVDDLSIGYRDLCIGAGFFYSRIGDQESMREFLKQHEHKPFDGVFHFAAKSLVSESALYPDLYFENNVDQTQKFLELLTEFKIRNFIFSSSCAIFGDPSTSRISEKTPKNPISVYGQTKLKAEEVIESFCRDSGLKAISLRYFNACGAEPKLRVGEKHYPETHLIPLLIKAALEGSGFSLFGNEYPTPDGTCIRDYIHVTDLAEAHEAAFLRLQTLPHSLDGAGIFEAYSLGSEKGYSVLEMLAVCEKITGKKINTVIRAAREGDPPQLIADSTLAKKLLGFQPKHGLEKIFETALRWYLKSTQLKPAVFLDRDGTLNVDPGYINSPDKMVVKPGIAEALEKLGNAGYKLIVVSNQSGVGRGLIHEPDLIKIHRRLNDLISTHNVYIQDFTYCVHLPDLKCDCRKPGPKLITDAAAKHHIDLSRSVMIGDRASDLMAGRRAQCGRVALVRTGDGRHTEAELSDRFENRPDFIGDSLNDVADWILSS